MDIRTIRKVIDIVRETGVSELEIQEDEAQDKKFRIRVTNYVSSPHSVASHSPIERAEINNIPQSETTLQVSTQSMQNSEELAGYQVKSPMVGTVYLSSAPTTKPFVTVGQQVKKGDVLCLIEAMKMYNRVESEISGTIKARSIENEQPVEYGQILFTIEPDKA